MLTARLKRWVYALRHPIETLNNMDVFTLRRAFVGVSFAFWCLSCFMFGFLTELYR